jgi:DNA polymerase-3 subunit gamma/tau
MAYMALARKYRPRQLGEVVGQQALLRTLKNALDGEKIHPAYIFAGIRGVGKTTVARIFAKGLNCEKGVTSEPCDHCSSCTEIASGHSMDVLEIDGATHTQVDQARDLTQLARYTPARDRYRVFIIDEVHMLSKNAFNALLKTIEEPPPHVVFLLATTEPGRIPETIHSRAQLFQFRPVEHSAVASYLRLLAQREGFSAEPQALELVARCGGGSVRDSLTLLDRLLAYSEGNLTEAAAVEVLGVAGRESLFAIMDSFASSNVEALLSILDDGFERGFDMERLINDLASHARLLLRARLAPQAQISADDPSLAARLKEQASRFSAEDLMRLLDLLAATQFRLKGAPDARALIELQLSKAALLPRILPLEQILSGAVLPQLPPSNQVPAPEPVASPKAETIDEAPDPPTEREESLRFTGIIPFKRMDEAEAVSYELNDERAARFREAACDRFFPARAVLESAAISLDPEGILHISCSNGGSKAGMDFLSSPGRLRELEELAREIGYPGPITIERSNGDGDQALEAGSEKQPPEGKKPEQDEAVRNVLKVLGGHVMKVTPLKIEADGAEETHDEPE